MHESITHRVNLDDLDFMGIVSHYQWLLLMERLRTKMVEKPFARMQQLELGFVVAEANLKYRKSARYLELITLHLEVLSLKNTSCVVRHTFVGANQDIYVVGDITLVCVDKSGRPSMIPDEFRNLFATLVKTENPGL